MFVRENCHESGYAKFDCRFINDICITHSGLWLRVGMVIYHHRQRSKLERRFGAPIRLECWWELAWEWASAQEFG